MLRRRMGDAAFLAFLKDFIAQHRLQNVTTEQFFEAAAAAMPKDQPDRKLESFVDSWVEGTGIPKLTLESKISGKVPNLKLTVTVKQTEVSDRFSTVVPVVVQFPRGKPRTILLETGPDAASQTISVTAKPSKVTLDPDGSVLKR
jgi:aminopeptidase N